jgi:SNF2 family DNA or RNA helicase
MSDPTSNLSEEHNSEFNEEFYLEHANSPSWSGENMLKTLDVGFRNQLQINAPKSSQPPQIKIPLRDHQKALIYAMEEREKASMEGFSFGSMTTYANYGVLGDEVGSGKSLVVLGYIATMKNKNNLINKRRVLLPNSSPSFFSIFNKEYKNNKGSSLIIVPHTIFRQWQDYIKNQTTLNVFIIKSVKDITPILYTAGSLSLSEDKIKERDEVINKLKTSDAVLVSNTLYGDLQYNIDQINNEKGFKSNPIIWNRIFLDEVDSINITGGQRPLRAPFIWFITATWANFIMDGSCIRPLLLTNYNQNKTQYTKELGDWLKAEIGAEVQQPSPYNYYGRVNWLRVRSKRFLQEYNSNHILRAMVLLSCSKLFLDESRKMPQIIESTILCEQSATHRAINNIVSPQIKNMLHAGNIEGALQELGVSMDTTVNLIEAVRIEREKELLRLKKTLTFKEGMDYATPQAKEAALNSLKLKIALVENQLKSFEQNMNEKISEECPICYDDAKQNSGVVTPCCHRIFCGGCILESLSRTMNCPLCRTPIATNQLVQVVEKSKGKKKKEESKLLSKPRQLLKFLKDNPTARVLVFSRYENPFIALERDCELEGITYHTLRGNKDVIANTIKSFEKGEKRVLFLPTESVGAGLNLVSATHIVLLHAMTPEEEKQAVGRAYRLGRTENLSVIKLLHEGETYNA